MLAPDSGVAPAQSPAPGSITLDHLAHFVPSIDDAGDALEGLGFTLTPFSAQSHRLEPGGPLVSAGTGNRCVMFERGYLEFLTPTANTALAEQLRTAIGRYVGIHLIAFGTSSPHADRDRLESEGFRPLPPVDLQRPIATANGEDIARFTVVRVAPETMPEGRIQYCQHRTPELLWQPRWLGHPNGTTALKGVVICAPEGEATAERYARFTGVARERVGAAWRIRTARGDLHFVDTPVLRGALGIDATVPSIAGAILEARDVERAGTALRGGDARVRGLDGGRLLVTLPPALGGFFIYESASSTPLVFS
ncbi:MAG: VOC family protein [Burkholderiales bacterium]